MVDADEFTNPLHAFDEGVALMNTTKQAAAASALIQTNCMSKISGVVVVVN